VGKADVDLERVIHGTLFGEAVVNAEIAALLADDRGYYVAVNDGAVALTGYTRASLMQFRAGELAADEGSRGIYENISRGRKMQGRKRVRRKNGEIVDLRYWAIPARVAQMQYFLLLLWNPRPA
jgi:PAS domain S-box-containing protein